jgi:hypothetical protein
VPSATFADPFPPFRTSIMIECPTSDHAATRVLCMPSGYAFSADGFCETRPRKGRKNKGR